MTLKLFLTDGIFWIPAASLSVDLFFFFRTLQDTQVLSSQLSRQVQQLESMQSFPQTHPHSLSSNNWHISAAAFVLAGPPLRTRAAGPLPAPNRTGVITLQIRSRRLTYKPNDSLTLLCAKFRQRAFRQPCHCTNLRPRIDARLLRLSKTPPRTVEDNEYILTDMKL